jgi:hypothetical protein
MKSGNALIGHIIAEVARRHSIAISVDDPIVAVVLMNQVILEEYLRDALGPTLNAISDAREKGIAEIREFAAGQTTELEDASLKGLLKERTAFLSEQAALYDEWHNKMKALLDGQDTALQRVIRETVKLLRETPQGTMPRRPGGRRWLWAVSGVLVGGGIVGALWATVLHLPGIAIWR